MRPTRSRPDVVSRVPRTPWPLGFLAAGALLWGACDGAREHALTWSGPRLKGTLDDAGLLPRGGRKPSYGGPVGEPSHSRGDNCCTLCGGVGRTFMCDGDIVPECYWNCTHN